MLLTRPPLGPKPSLDLHVLSLPPAFVLSQDQTLKLKAAMPLSLTFEPLHIPDAAAQGPTNIESHLSVCASISSETETHTRQ